MRLQIEIHRHTLPPVSIIYNTSSSHSSVKTISELLAAVDKIIPLESTDGEWGLEDYVVEVAATSDQANLYECLHYQLIKEVFREDDEVVIRGLTSDEIRERRQGGRLQILSDGRHLFDGVAWGRRYNVHGYRPGIIIPPRKRRRLLPPEENPQQQEALLQLESINSGAHVGMILGEDDDGEDDDEYEDDSYDEDDESEDEIEETSTQVVTRQEFDNADTDTESDSSKESTSEDEYINLVQDDEVQLLLKEAGEVEEAYNSLPLEFRVTSPQTKRKRDELEDSSQNGTNGTFEGFSSPVKVRMATLADDDSLGGQIQGMIGEHIVTEPGDDHDVTVSNGTTQTQGDRHLNGQAGTLHMKQILKSAHTKTLPKDDNSEDDTSSSEDSSSDSSSDSGSDSESDSGSSGDSSDDSDSTSDSDQSDSEDTSSSGGSESESESEVETTPINKKDALNAAKPSQNLDSEPTINSGINNPPGSGTKRTRANNDRIKRRKRLAHLKEQGLLPPEAGFEALKAYDLQNPPDDNVPDNMDSPSLSSELARRKEEMLNKLNEVYDQHDGMADPSVENSTASRIEDSQPQPHPSEKENQKKNEVDVPTVTEPKSTTPNVVQKRRLDIESTRRLLFGSLGLRNPKTPAAEQALREKLSKPVREIRTRQREPEGSEAMEKTGNDPWKNKLVISAIECVQEGLVLSPPPFPFRQRWEREPQKKKARLSDQFYQQENANNSTITTLKIATPAQPENPKSLTDSHTISAGATDLDNIAYDGDLEKLPDLVRSDVQIDAVIAYKQLQLNAKYEPEPSPYQIAKVIKIEGDLIDLLLARRHRDRPDFASFDDETGQRIYNKFEMPIDELQAEDEGLRESTFEDMIGPKLIKAAEVQVPSSEPERTSQVINTSSIENSAVIPESAPSNLLSSAEANIEEVEVNTPRRNEITNLIKDAGFNTALNEQLLQPIDLLTMDVASESLLQADPNSPPSVSMVETVDYPHVSTIDINQSSLVDQAASSSHQDAQRVSPDISDIEHSNLTTLQIKNLKKAERENSQASSLASEVPLSQTNDAAINDGIDDIEGGSQGGVQLRGGDGHDSGSASEDLDSDGLPSLRFLTSQRQRSSRKKQSRLSAKVSPPPLRKNRSPLNTGNSSQVEPDSPDPLIKISASQKPSLSMSQIPQDTSVVDLTVSSDPAVPSEDGDGDYESPRTRRSAARNAKAKASAADSQGARRTMKSAFAGLGSRKSLTSKTRSNV